MKDGFIKVAIGTPDVRVADVTANTDNIKKLILEAHSKKVNILILPELCITGYTCGDLFFDSALISSAKSALLEIISFTEDKDPIVVVGLPLMYGQKLFNCAAVIHDGEISGIVPKTNIPDDQSRYFSSAKILSEGSFIVLNEECATDIGNDLIFVSDRIDDFSFGIEINEDFLAPIPQNQKLALNGANIILNPAAIGYTVGTYERLSSLVNATSAKLNCGYVLATAGIGESTANSVYSGFGIISENGKVLAEKQTFQNSQLVISEIDVKNLSYLRKKNSLFAMADDYRKNYFYQKITDTEITRNIEKNPFFPDNIDKNTRLEEILQIASNALARRIEHTYSKKAVLGISGGLDSTLALLVAVRAMKILNRPASDILAITMPCFGTTKRTRSNSEILCKELGVTFKEINITASVKQHFSDIGHNETDFDVTYENSQARERTQVLMDVANKENGIVIGTGDLSELALGWATYNGDHMSMYGVNSSIPKTLIRHIVRYEAENSDDALKSVLFDILDTPVSPELLPADDKGEIAQKTEDLVGPYDLHDFFLYHFVRYGSTPKKIYRLACYALPEYDKETILHWLKIFLRRFFIQQFKRSCQPDGARVGTVSLSPAFWKMPTDASYNLWLDELENM